MRKYRSGEDDLDAIVGTSSAATPHPQFLQHMIDYEDEQEDASFTGETIDEEFSSYINSVPKRTAALDPLKFWAVSTYNRHNNYIADIY
jgi:hypothetical protein